MRVALMLAGAGALALSGCAAAALPVVAAAGIAKHARDGRQDRQERRARKKVKTPPLQPGQVVETSDGKVVVTSLTALPPPDGSVAAPVQGGAKVPPEMQYLYGSGEAAALSLQAYRALWNYVHVEIGYLRDKTQARSVVLSRGSTLTAPKFDLCGKRPLAVMFDVDETVLLNLGFEADTARRGGGYDQGRWTRWEQTGADKVVAVPGAAETIAALRREGLTVIYNSNRSTSTAAQTAAALDGAGLGPVTIGDTLVTRDDGAPSGKDERRWKASERYCVVAMAGDQLGDFSDLFNAPEFSTPVRRNTAAETLIAPLWGAGWFVLPNPVYGTGLKGGMDEVFPKDKQWADPAEEKK